MTALEFLQKRDFVKEECWKYNGPRKHMITQDGTEISLQRGINLYSKPEIPWKEVHGGAVIQRSGAPFDYPEKYDRQIHTAEMGLYGNQTLQENDVLLMYCTEAESYLEDTPNEDKLYVFANVPLRVVDSFIQKHGGYSHTKE